MDETFMIPVTYGNEELEFEGKLLLLGYLHKIEVQVNGIPVLFEPDEERNYRALISPEQIEKEGQKLNPYLLQAIAQQLESLLK